MSTPSPETPGLPLRALAMVLLSAAIVFAGLGWLGLSDSDSDSGGVEATVAATTTPAPPTTTAAPATTAAPPPVESTPEAPAETPAPTANAAALLRTPIRVYNNSTVDGLAATTADNLRAAGWNVTDVRNYDTGQIPRSTVFYGTTPGEQEAAEKVAQEMGVTAAPRFDGIIDAPAGVIVILAGDGAN